MVVPQLLLHSRRTYLKIDMGTNYYLHQAECPHCHHKPDVLHIGKSSGGWCFALHVIKGVAESLGDWVNLFSVPTNMIKDEYGHVISPGEMLNEITNRSRSGSPNFSGYKSEAHFLELNQAEWGPNGLLRVRIGPYCTAHGAGTWDLLDHEFS